MNGFALVLAQEDIKDLLTYFKRDAGSAGSLVGLIAWLVPEAQIRDAESASMLLAQWPPYRQLDPRSIGTRREFLLLVDRIAAKHNVIQPADAPSYRSIREAVGPAFNVDATKCLETLQMAHNEAVNDAVRAVILRLSKHYENVLAKDRT